MPKFVLMAALSGIIAAAQAGCGSSDSPPAAAAGDCSKCSASSKDTCSKTYSDCTSQPGSDPTKCQQAIDILCALTGSLDAGTKG